MPTMLSTSFGKTFFIWRFILNGKKIHFRSTIFYQKLLVVSVPVLCFQNNYRKVNFMAQNWV